jgi:hypothetical protein
MSLFLRDIHILFLLKCKHEKLERVHIFGIINCLKTKIPSVT